MKRLLLAALLLCSCSRVGAECEEFPLPESIAALGPSFPFSPEVVILPIGPATADYEITALDIGTAPGWGCAPPSRAGVFVGPIPYDPFEALGLAPGLETPEENGFATRTVTIAPVSVRAGERPWIAIGLAAPAECGAKALAPHGASLVWRAGTWRPEDGALVARVHCGD